MDWWLFTLGRPSWTYLKLSSRTCECPKLSFPGFLRFLKASLTCLQSFRTTCFLILENPIFLSARIHRHHTHTSLFHLCAYGWLPEPGQLVSSPRCMTFYVVTYSLSFHHLHLFSFLWVSKVRKNHFFPYLVRSNLLTLFL